MNLPDVNVLVNAYRPEGQHHQQCRDWLLQALRTTAPMLLLDVVTAGFLRIVTHPRIFSQPASVAEAAGFLIELKRAPQVEIVSCGENWWPCFATQLGKPAIQGNLISDAHIAAAALTHAATIVTLDHDFKRFDASYHLLR